MTPLSTYSADCRFLVEAAAKAADLTDPVAFNPLGYLSTLVEHATRGPLAPLDGALVRQWMTRSKYYPAVTFGIRLHKLEGIPVARCVATIDGDYNENAYDLFVVSHADYVKLFRIVLRLSREKVPESLPPVLPDGQLEVLRQHTPDYR